MSEHNLNFMPTEGFRARAKDVVENPFLRRVSVARWTF
jgi:hypothetical protein